VDPSTSPGGVGGAASGGPLKLSIVIPVYNGASSIKPLVERLHEELKAHYELEIVLVNDCSPDNSAEVCAALAERHGWVRFIHLARNFGEHNAVMAGLNYCTGDCAVIMDDDFQNPPTEVVKLVEKLQEGYDVTYSYYESKKHNLFRNLGSYFNNAVASVMIKKPWGLYLSSFKAINRFTIDEVVKYQGPYPYIDGLILRATRNYGTQLVQHDPRHEGRSNYTLRKLMRLWLNMFTNFSILPLRVASIAGFVFAVIGVVLAVVFLIEKLANPELPVGWTSTVVIILIISGVQLFALGMIGEYLGRLFLKDNGSPQFVVRSTQNCPGTEKRSD
jgi:undecaprenyl-phosphate 4-deoxy-4-formamido-L-arabinose transferase